MIRAVLFSALICVAFATPYGKGLKGKLFLERKGARRSQPVSVSRSSFLQPELINVARGRFPGVSDQALGEVIRLMLQKGPSSALISRLNIPGLRVDAPVPAAQRLKFLRQSFRLFPRVFFDDHFVNSLQSVFLSRGLRISRSDLINRLPLFDTVFARSLRSPMTVGQFGDFFFDQFSGISRIPTIRTISSRLINLNLDPVHPISNDVRLLSNILPSIGLPTPSLPAVTLPGLVRYLGSIGIPFDQFVSTARRLNINFNSDISGLQFGNFANRLSFLSSPSRSLNSLLRRDILPLLVLRFHSLPSSINSQLRFGGVCTDFLSQDRFGDLRTFNIDFVSRLLLNFDNYLRRLLHGNYLPSIGLNRLVNGGRISSLGQFKRLQWWSPRSQTSCSRSFSNRCFWSSRFQW
nr:CP52k-like protein 1 [Parasacculina yatsui]